MDISNVIINNWNDIYTYFQVIRAYKPDSILDVGMFLKRTGCISRRTMSFEALEAVQLDGIDLFPEYQLNIYLDIYDHVYTVDNMNLLPENKKYDMIIMLNTTDFISKEQENILFQYAIKHARYILTDMNFIENQIQNGMHVKYHDVTVENSQYALVDTN